MENKEKISGHLRALGTVTKAPETVEYRTFTEVAVSELRAILKNCGEDPLRRLNKVSQITAVRGKCPEEIPCPAHRDTRDMVVVDMRHMRPHAYQTREVVASLTGVMLDAFDGGFFEHPHGGLVCILHAGAREDMLNNTLAYMRRRKCFYTGLVSGVSMLGVGDYGAYTIEQKQIAARLAYVLTGVGFAADVGDTGFIDVFGGVDWLRNA